MVDGKAKLLREDYCDGLGDCLPACPTGAITFEEREAPAYDAGRRAGRQDRPQSRRPLPCGCPGQPVRGHRRQERPRARSPARQRRRAAASGRCRSSWCPVNAPYFDGANLLIAADCTAYAYGDFHRDFIRGRKITLVGCPKLDEGDYSGKAHRDPCRTTISRA